MERVEARERRLPPARDAGGQGLALLRGDQVERPAGPGAHPRRGHDEAEQARLQPVPRQRGLHGRRGVWTEALPHVLRGRRSVLLWAVDVQAEGAAAVVRRRLARSARWLPRPCGWVLAGHVLRRSDDALRPQPVRRRRVVLQRPGWHLHAAGVRLHPVSSLTNSEMAVLSRTRASCLAHLSC